MITTVDKKVLKRVDSGWVIGVEIGTWIYRPSLHKVHIHPDLPDVYSDWQTCKDECDRLNHPLKE